MLSTLLADNMHKWHYARWMRVWLPIDSSMLLASGEAVPPMEADKKKGCQEALFPDPEGTVLRNVRGIHRDQDGTNGMTALGSG